MMTRHSENESKTNRLKQKSKFICRKKVTVECKWCWPEKPDELRLWPRGSFISRRSITYSFISVYEVNRMKHLTCTPSHRTRKRVCICIH